MDTVSSGKVIDTVESITRIDFSIYSNNDVIKDSVIDDPNGIVIADTYSNNEAVQGGVIDTRLGITEKRQECGTCKETALRCPGHFGHIKFVEPVFHMGFLIILKNILNCICIRCNKLLVYKNEDQISRLLKNKQGKQRFQEIRALTKKVTHCQKENYGCGTPAHKITIDKKNGVMLLAEPQTKNTDLGDGEDKKNKNRRVLTPQLCYDILRAVSNEDCMILGLDPTKSRPEDMIIVNFPFPPVQIRPSIKMEILSASPMDDSLTHILIDIIKNNENLRDDKGDGSLGKSLITNDNLMLLQCHVATYYDNNIIGIPKCVQKNKKVVKSLTERLKGKEGRVRGNLMGKRVNFSGRTVITSDPNIPLNGVGIPLIIAMNLTYPEVVTQNNLAYLTALIKNGRNKYPGANYVIQNVIDSEGYEDKKITHLKYANRLPVLKPGDVVERHLVNGDIVLFNRQPSLHKLSMMGHIVHVIPNEELLTFRVNVNITDPYNADWYRL